LRGHLSSHHTIVTVAPFNSSAQQFGNRGNFIAFLFRTDLPQWQSFSRTSRRYQMQYRRLAAVAAAHALAVNGDMFAIQHRPPLHREQTLIIVMFATTALPEILWSCGASRYS